MAFDLSEIEVAIDDVNLPGTGAPNKAEPLSAIKQIGWDFKQKPTCEEFNWLFNKIYLALEDLDSRTIVAGQLPVGSYYTNEIDSRNPQIILGYGTWVSRAGQVIVGAGTHVDGNGESRTFIAGQTGGEYSHTLSIAEMPSHTHNFPGTSGGGWNNNNGGIARVATQTTYATGGNQAHNNTQPYIVAYVWVRTA